MFKRIFWLSALLAVSAFAAQVVVKSGVLKHQDVAIVGESTWDKLANATSQTTQELLNSGRSFIKSASFLLPNALIQSLTGELPSHDATVGSTPGQAGVSGGSASYSIPIALPPGRKGMQPNISLNYSSKGGNGIAGMGWNVSGLSSLHRCPQTLEQDGQIRAVDYSMNDRLCFDGQRLVATSGTYGALNTKYSTEIDSFTRITQLGGDLNAVNSYFKVEYKSGEIAYFGGNTTALNNARVIAGGLTKPLNWLIARSEDRLGNNIVYTYSNFTNGEVQPAAIFYTGFNATQGDRKIEFVYEARPTTNGANDQSSSYLAGGLTRQTKRLTTIKTWVAAEAVREYRLNYGAISATSGRSLLRSVQECALLSAVATCRRPISFDWQEAPSVHKFSPAMATTGYTPSRFRADFDGDGSMEMLVSNDANQSFLMSTTANRSVRSLIDVSGIFAAGIPALNAPDLNGGYHADFDVDGKTDLVSIDSSNNIIISFWDGPSTATTFAQAFTRSWNTGIQAPDWGIWGIKYSGDVDGDGRADIALINKNSGAPDSCSHKFQIYKNTVNVGGSSLPASFTMVAEQCMATIVLGDPVTGFQNPVFEQFSQAKDINGDGLMDFILTKVRAGSSSSSPGYVLYGQRNPAYAVVRTELNALFPGVDPMNSQEGYSSVVSGYVPAFTFWVDINGDGLDDYLSVSQVNGAGVWIARLNRGNGLSNRITINQNNGIELCQRNNYTASQCNSAYKPWLAGRMQVADVDHDGRAEILVPRRFASRVCTRLLRDIGDGNLPQATSPEGKASASPAFRKVGTLSATEPYYSCPENPLTGYSEPDLSFGSIPIEGMYWNGEDSGDASAYLMNALRFVETAPNQFSIQERNTEIVLSRNRTFGSFDMYGDGLEDSFTNTACPWSSPNACKVLLTNDPAVSPTTLPWGYAHLSNQLFINEDIGSGGDPAISGKTPKMPELMTAATDSIGNKTTWTYYPLSSNADRDQPTDTPLYTLPTDPALRYVDARHTYFSSSMQVVSEMTQSNGLANNTNTTRYSYSEAMYNTQGRGFQGFRKIIEEDMSKDILLNPIGLRTTTTFSQKYPLTSMVEQVVVNPITRTGETGPISRTTNKWRCNRLDRNDTAACNVTPGSNPVRFVYQSYSQNVTFDLNTAIGGLPDKLTSYSADYNHDTTACDGGTIALAAGMDANGNITAKTRFVSDYSDGTPGYKNYIALSCNRTRNTFAAADTTNWWLDKLTNTETRNEILHGVDQVLPVGASNPVYTTNTAYTWNTNRTLASETFQNGIANQQKLTAYTYPASNNYGLPLSVLVTASGDQNAGGRSTSTTYSSDGYFPLSVTNALGHTATTAVRLRDGLPISVTDPNGLRTLTTYDAFSQAVLVKARGGLDTQYLAPDKQVAATWCVGGSCGLSDAAYQLTSVQDGSPTSVSTHDKLGRVLRTQSKLLDGTTSYSDTQYNNKGQTIAQSLPYRSGDTPLWTYFVSYDIAGRLTAKTTPQQHATRGDMVTTYVYTGRTTAIQVCGSLDTNTTNCLNLSRTTDSTGRYVETADALGGVTKFWFDANGQAAVLQDVKGSQIKATYNAIGQRSSVNDPNQGVSNFTYNALGEVLTQTDARSITSTTTYDKLGRKTQFTVTADENGDGVNDAIVDTWSYDPVGAKGQLSQSKRMINAVLERQESSSFDALIRPSAVAAIQNTGSGTTRSYSSEFQYDTYYGRVLAQFFPNGEGEQFIFNQYGYETEQRNATNASIYRQIVTVDSAGRPTRELKGFNLSTDTAYWPNGQTKSIIHQKNGVTIRKIDYAYDVFGNVATQELNNGMAGNTLESFSYDSLHRLTQSTRTGAAATTVTYGYDAAGNFNFKSDFSLATGTPYNLSTGGLGGGGANAVKSVSLKAGGTRSYGYDASGNMTSDNASFSAIYDHANLATKLQRGAVINYFIYGPNNAKARQTGTDGSKVYLGGYEDWITAGQTKVSLGNYAQVTNGTGGRVLHYFLTDRLGSVDAVTDGNGVLIETRGYDAFGAPRTGVWGDASQIASTAITPKGFTSHEHLNSVQLIHMNGRMYDYQLGRFLGVDPFIQAPTNSQSMNPYSYIMNNPLSGTDPTGYLIHTPICPGPACPTAPTPPSTPEKSKPKTKWEIACSGGGNCSRTARSNGAPRQGKNSATIDITKEEGYKSGDKYEKNSHGHKPFGIDSIFDMEGEITRHHYDVETLICQGSKTCTFEILSDVLKKYSYPNALLKEAPVPDGNLRLVFIVLPSVLKNGDMNDPNNYFVPGGLIQQGPAEGGGIMNVTMRGHVVYPGIIIRQIVERDGSFFIQTHGIGYNTFSGGTTEAQRDANLMAALSNDFGGYRAFKALDKQAKKYYEKTYAK